MQDYRRTKEIFLSFIHCLNSVERERVCIRIGYSKFSFNQVLIEIGYDTPLSNKMMEKFDKDIFREFYRNGK